MWVVSRAARRASVRLEWGANVTAGPWSESNDFTLQIPALWISQRGEACKKWQKVQLFRFPLKWLYFVSPSIESLVLRSIPNFRGIEDCGSTRREKRARCVSLIFAPLGSNYLMLKHPFNEIWSRTLKFSSRMRNFTRQDSRTVTIYGVYDLEFVIEFRVSYSKYKFLHLFAINKSFIAQRLSFRNTRLVNCLFRVYFAKDEGRGRGGTGRGCAPTVSPPLMCKIVFAIVKYS